MKYLFTLLLSIALSPLLLAQTITLQGKIIDKETKEPIIFGNVSISQKGTLITGAQTDIDGNYKIVLDKAGLYEIEATYIGYAPNKTTLNLSQENDITFYNIELGTSTHTYSCRFTLYYIPTIEHDKFEKGKTLKASEIRRLPIK